MGCNACRALVRERVWCLCVWVVLTRACCVLMHVVLTFMYANPSNMFVHIIMLVAFTRASVGDVCVRTGSSNACKFTWRGSFRAQRCFDERAGGPF